MHRIPTLALAALLLAPAAAMAADGNDPALATAGPVTAPDGSVASLIAAEKAKKKTCAVATIAGPANSTDIVLSLANLTDAHLTYLTVDPYRAYHGKSLIFASAEVVGITGGGTATLIYPSSDTGLGPAVFGFTGFGQDDDAEVAFDPDTYSDPGFSATVKNMDGTKIEVAFASGRRCAGTLEFSSSLHHSVAKLTRTSP